MMKKDKIKLTAEEKASLNEQKKVAREKKKADKIALKAKRKADRQKEKAEFKVIKAQTIEELGPLKAEYKAVYNDYLQKRKLKKQNPSEENAQKLSEVTDRMMDLRRQVSILKRRISIGQRIEKWSNSGGHTRKELYQKRSSYALIAPFFILFFVFTILPVFMALALSFTSFDLLQAPRFIGFGNYRALFLTDQVFLRAVRNTLILALITGPVSYIMAFVFAWLINELKPRMRSIMTLIFYAPSISGNTFLIWRLIFASDEVGFANAFMMRWFGSEPRLWLQDPTYIIPIIIVVQLWLSLGISFLAFIAGLQSTDRTLYEAGAVDGVKNRWQELWYITLPQMKSQLMFGAVMQITASFAIAAVAMEIAGFPSVQYAGHTLVTHLIDFGSIRYELGYASAIATLLFILMISANILVRKIIRRVGT